MSEGRRRWIWAAVAAVGLALAGCGDSNVFDGKGDDDTRQSRKEAGVEALNQHSWDEAIAIFDDLYDPAQPDPEVSKYLASAYLGKTGFNTLDLVADIAAAQEEDGADTESIVYDSVTKLFDTDGDGVIARDEVEGEGGKLALIQQALEILLPGYAGVERQAATAPAPRPTDGQRFQAGLYAAVHAVLSVVVQLEDPDQPGRLLLTLDSLNAKADRVIPNVTAPARLDQDLALVDDARDVLIGTLADDLSGDDQNDIAAEFEAFLTEIGFLGGATPGEVTDQELRDYLWSLLGRNATKASAEVTP